MVSKSTIFLNQLPRFRAEKTIGAYMRRASCVDLSGFGERSISKLKPRELEFSPQRGIFEEQK